MIGRQKNLWYNERIEGLTNPLLFFLDFCERRIPDGEERAQLPILVDEIGREG